MVNTALRWCFFLPAVFVACRRGLGKRRNIPSGETARAKLIIVVPAQGRDDDDREGDLFGRDLPRRRRRVEQIGGEVCVRRPCVPPCFLPYTAVCTECD